MFEEYHLRPLDHNALPPGYDQLPPEEKVKAVLLGCFSYLLPIIIALLLCAILGSCTTTRYVPVETVRTDTVRIIQLQRDSIYIDHWLHDSTFVSQAQRGDTVLLTTDRWHTLTLTEYRDRWLHDSIYIATHDTIPQIVEVPKEVKVEKPLTWWQQTRLHLANILLWLAAIYAAVWIIRKRSWWLTLFRKLFR